MAKEWGSLRMKDPYKNTRDPTAISKPQIFASRVIPLRFALAGFEFIDMLPLITALPQEGADIELILKKRNRMLIEIMKEIHGLDL